MTTVMESVSASPLPFGAKDLFDLSGRDTIEDDIQFDTLFKNWDDSKSPGVNGKVVQQGENKTAGVYDQHPGQGEMEPEHTSPLKHDDKFDSRKRKFGPETNSPQDGMFDVSKFLVANSPKTSTFVFNQQPAQDKMADKTPPTGSPKRAKVATQALQHQPPSRPTPGGLPPSNSKTMPYGKPPTQPAQQQRQQEEMRTPRVYHRPAFQNLICAKRQIQAKPMPQGQPTDTVGDVHYYGDKCYFKGYLYIGPTKNDRPKYKSKQSWEWDIYPHGVSKLHGKLRIQIKQRGNNPCYPMFPNTLEGLMVAAFFRDKEVLRLWNAGVLVRSPNYNFDHGLEWSFSMPKRRQKFRAAAAAANGMVSVNHTPVAMTGIPTAAGDFGAVAASTKNMKGLKAFIKLGGGLEALVQRAGGFEAFFNNFGGYQAFLKTIGGFDALIELAGGFEALIKVFGGFENYMKKCVVSGLLGVDTTKSNHPSMAMAMAGGPHSKPNSLVPYAAPANMSSMSPMQQPPVHTQQQQQQPTHHRPALAARSKSMTNAQGGRCSCIRSHWLCPRERLTSMKRCINCRLAP